MTVVQLPRQPIARRRHGRTVAIIALLMAAVVGVTIFVVVLVTRHRWHMVWEDTFDGSAVNTSQWNVRNETYLPYENSILTSRPENVRVGGGKLTIEARREQRTVYSTSRDYTSGYLDTIGKHSWRFGHFEMRAKLPLATGLWPAFWLRSDEGRGEIDIMEAIGGMPRTAQQSVLQSTNGGGGKEVHQHEFVDSSIAAWHVYGATVGVNAISFTVDGRTIFTVKTKDAPWLAQTFDEPMNIRLNLQVGGSLPNYYGHPLSDATVMPASYEVDWVRVFQDS